MNTSARSTGLPLLAAPAGEPDAAEFPDRVSAQPAALAEVYWEHHASVRTFARRLLGDDLKHQRHGLGRRVVVDVHPGQSQPALGIGAVKLQGVVVGAGGLSNRAAECVRVRQRQLRAE